VKPNFGYQGKDIIITKDPREYLNKDYVIQKQIIPNLINRRVWTARFYIIATYFNNKLKFWMTKQTILMFGVKVFNKKIIDPYQLITNGCYKIKFFKENPELDSDLCEIKNQLLTKKYAERMKNIHIMMKESKNKLKEQFKPNKEVNNSYHILAFDLMFDKNEKPYILEINSKPSWAANHIDCSFVDRRCSRTLEWELYQRLIINLIKPCLKGQEPISDKILFEIL